MARIRLIGLLLGEVVAVSTFHRLRHPLPRWPISEWLTAGPADVLVMGVLRGIGLVLSYWLLVSTIAYVMARLADVPAALRAVEWATLPFVRRIADGVAVSALSVSLAAPFALPPLAMAAEAPEPVVVTTEQGAFVPPGFDAPPAYTPAVDSVESDNTPAAVAVETEPDTAAPADDPQLAVAAPTDLPSSHVVARGEHLWSIAEDRLRAVGRTEPLGDADIAPYWARLVEANRPHLRSGDPNLIHPGEVIVFPEAP